MEFPYYKVLDFPRHQKRTRLLPWMRIGIFNPDNPKKVVYPLGLVDSGSDASIIDRELGEELGYEIEKGQPETIVGMGGGQTPGFIHKLGYLIENPDDSKDIIKYVDGAVFTKNNFPPTMPQQTAIFGTIGFFRHLLVTFAFPSGIEIQTLTS
jgi:8-oxo-dGTP pyrophosphatase MutT (NUDIX family)